MLCHVPLIHSVSPAVCMCWGLQEKRRVRLKDGFRPPRTGRRTDAAGDAPKLRQVPDRSGDDA